MSKICLNCKSGNTFKCGEVTMRSRFRGKDELTDHHLPVEKYICLECGCVSEYMSQEAIELVKKEIEKGHTCNNF